MAPPLVSNLRTRGEGQYRPPTSMSGIHGDGFPFHQWIGYGRAARMPYAWECDSSSSRASANSRATFWDTWCGWRCGGPGVGHRSLAEGANVPVHMRRCFVHDGGPILAGSSGIFW